MPDYPAAKNIAETAAELGRLACEPKINAEGLAVPTPVVIWPRDQKIESLEKYLKHPLRKRAAVTVYDLASFTDYVLHHRETGTTIFATLATEGSEFKAIIDYHLAEEELAANPHRARWREHTCTYRLAHTEEWKRWMEWNGKLRSQQDVASFIEDNRLDIVDPAAADMMELVKTLIATQAADFKSFIRLDNGDREFAYSNTTAAKAGLSGQMTVPQTFRLRLPIFIDGPAYDIICRFRYRIVEGKLALGYEVETPHKLIELALTDTRNAIRGQLNLPVLRGTAS